MNKKAFTLAPSPHPLRAYLSPNIKVVQFMVEGGFTPSGGSSDRPGEDDDEIGDNNWDSRKIQSDEMAPGRWDRPF